MKQRLLSLAFATLLLSGCLGGHKIPEGPQTIVGVLEPVEFSLSRRGTHHILVDGRPLYFVESRAIDLFTHERRTVTITGVVEQNVDPKDLPVLLVETIDDPEANLRTWRIRDLGLDLSVPASWSAVIEGPRASFTATGSTRIPALTVFRQGKSGLSFDFAAVSAGESSVSSEGIRAFPEPILDRPAVVKQDPQLGLLNVFVEDPAAAGAVIVFRFSQEGMQSLSDADGAIERIMDSLQSISALAASSSSAMSSGTGSAASGTGVQLGQPCGGSAGILCPSGFYCAITDTANNVGRCVRP